MALSLQVSSAVQGAASSPPATSAGIETDSSSSSGGDHTFAALMQGYMPGVQGTFGGADMQGTLSNTGAPNVSGSLAAQGSSSSVQPMTHDARQRGRKTESDAFNPAALQPFSGQPLVASALPQLPPSPQTEASQVTSGIGNSAITHTPRVIATDGVNDADVLAQVDTNLNLLASFTKPNQSDSDSQPEQSGEPDIIVQASQLNGPEGAPAALRSEPQASVSEAMIVANDHALLVEIRNTARVIQQAALAAPTLAGSRISTAIGAPLQVSCAVTAHAVEQAPGNDVSLSAKASDTPAASSVTSIPVLTFKQTVAPAHFTGSYAVATDLATNAPVQDNSGTTIVQTDSLAPPATVLSSLSMPTTGGSASSQSQSGTGDQGADNRQSIQTMARTGLTPPDDGMRIGMSGWLTNSQQHGFSANEHTEQAHDLPVSSAAVQMNFDRVATDSANRRLTNVMRADMTFGVQTESFGRVSVQTSLRGDQLLSQISLEHANLHASILATHMPILEARLNDKYNLNASVTVKPDSGSTAAQQQSPSREDGRRRSDAAPAAPSVAGLRAVSSTRIAQQPIVAGVLPLDAERLDVTI